MPLTSVATSLLAVPILLCFANATTFVVVAGFALAGIILCGGVLGLPVAPISLALFAGLGLVQGASFVAVAEINANVDQRALGYGVMAQIGNLGNLMGTPLLLAILTFGGDVFMLIAVGILYLVAITFCLFLRRLAQT